MYNVWVMYVHIYMFVTLAVVSSHLIFITFNKSSSRLKETAGCRNGPIQMNNRIHKHINKNK